MVFFCVKRTGFKLKPLRIFLHVICETPAYLSTYLQQRGIAYEVVCLDDGLPVPDDLDNVSGLIFMGGAGSVNDSKDWIAQELELIRKADALGVPMLGICFGAQLISKALGGKVWPGEELEVGWHTIEAVNEIENEPGHCTINTNLWLAGLPKSFVAFQWHAHTLSAPPGAIQLWRNSCYEQQGFVKGRALGMQFHLEFTAETIMDLSQRYSSDLCHTSDCVQSFEQINENIQQREAQLHEMADLIYDRWLAMTGLVLEG